MTKEEVIYLLNEIDTYCSNEIIWIDIEKIKNWINENIT